jgi:hypothetical protein
MRGTRGVRVLVPLAAVALCLGLFGAEALAGKKKKTTVTFFSGANKVNPVGKVTTKGSLKTANVCKPFRSVKLFQTDASGNVQATLDGSTTDVNGNWKLQGQLPNTVPATAPVYVKVKANKRTVGKIVCKAGFSPVLQLR